MPSLYELQAQLDTVNLKIALIRAGARRKAIRDIQRTMKEHGITTLALRKRLQDDPFAPALRP